MNKLLIGLSLAGLLAWLFGKKSSAAAPSTTRVPRPDPAKGYDYWRERDNDAVRQFTAANQDRMLAIPGSQAAGEAQRRYDHWFELHRQYAAKANEAWNAEHGVTR